MKGSSPSHGLSSRAANLSAVNQVERDYEATGAALTVRRLSCQARILGDLVIDVPPDSQVHKQVVRKRAEVHEIELDPVVRVYYVEVQEPDMHDPAGDLRRLEEALEFEWHLGQLRWSDLRVIQGLQETLRSGDWKVTVRGAQRQPDHRCVAGASRTRSTAWRSMSVPPPSPRTFAILASGEVIVSHGAMNPQIRFGEDLMSRVSYIMMNPGGDLEMTTAVRDALNKLVREVAAEAGIDVGDIMEMTLVGNPIMHHLVLGINPIELGGAPFALATDSATRIWASEIQIELHPNARIYVLPCIAGHVGADTAGVVLSEAPHLREEMTLLVDVGTNAEIVLGNRHALLAASSPTGPAFEGAQISGGQRAAPGAVERVRIDPQTLEPRFRVIGSEVWSDDPEFDDATAGVGITGICGSGIIEVVAEMFLAGIISSDGVIDGGLAARTSRIVAEGRTFSYILHEGSVDIRITQNDVPPDPAGQGGPVRGCQAADGPRPRR